MKWNGRNWRTERGGFLSKRFDVADGRGSVCDFAVRPAMRHRKPQPRRDRWTTAQVRGCARRDAPWGRKDRYLLRHRCHALHDVAAVGHCLATESAIPCHLVHRKNKREDSSKLHRPRPPIMRTVPERRACCFKCVVSLYPTIMGA